MPSKRSALFFSFFWFKPVVYFIAISFWIGIIVIQFLRVLVFPRRVASTAACSCSRGMVSRFNGATLDLAALNVTPNVPSLRGHLLYAHVPKRFDRCIRKYTQNWISNYVWGSRAPRDGNTI